MYLTEYLISLLTQSLLNVLSYLVYNIRAFVGINLRTCHLFHGYFLSVRPLDQLRGQLAHEGLL